MSAGAVLGVDVHGDDDGGGGGEGGDDDDEGEEGAESHRASSRGVEA